MITAPWSYVTSPATAPAPPEDLVTEALRDQWFERYETQTKHPCGLLPVAAEHGYRLGYQAAISIAARLRHCPTHGQQPANVWACPECLRELRDDRPAPAAAPSPPAGSLVEVVSDAIRRAVAHNDETWDTEARAAIVAVGGVLRREFLRSEGGDYPWLAAAAWLEREAER